MNARLTRAMLSDHQRRAAAEEQAMDFCILAGIALVAVCALVAVILGAAGL